MWYSFLIKMQKTASKSVKPFSSYSCWIGSTRGENLFNLGPLCNRRLHQLVLFNKFHIT
jgi:hypothetical protein